MPLLNPVLPVGPGERGEDGDDEPHSVDGRYQPAAPRPAERKTCLAGNQRGVRRRQVSGRT